MTNKEAKELSLEVWRYLAEHPEIEEKDDLPDDIYEKIADLLYCCPLCELFYALGEPCKGCPLGNCFLPNRSSPFLMWAYGISKSIRQTAAKEIVAVIEAWEAENEQ